MESVDEQWWYLTCLFKWNKHFKCCHTINESCMTVEDHRSLYFISHCHYGEFISVIFLKKRSFLDYLLQVSGVCSVLLERRKALFCHMKPQWKPQIPPALSTNKRSLIKRLYAIARYWFGIANSCNPWTRLVLLVFTGCC